MSGCTRQRLGPTTKRLKDRIKQTQTFLQHNVTLGQSENKANQLLLKLEGNPKSCKDLLEQLQEIIEEVNDRTEEGGKSTTFHTMLSSPPIEKQLKLELSMMHQQKPKKDARVLMSVCTVVLSS